MRHSLKIIYDIENMSYNEFMHNSIDRLTPYCKYHENKRYLTSGHNKDKWLKIKFIFKEINLKARFRIENLFFCGFKTTRDDDVIQDRADNSEVVGESIKREKLWWAFKSEEDFGLNCQFLNIKANYYDIQHAGSSRTKVQIGKIHLENAIRGLSRNRSRDEITVDETSRQHLFCLAISVSESLRFNPVRRFINEHMDVTCAISQEFRSLFTDWQNLSRMFLDNRTFKPMPHLNVNNLEDLNEVLCICLFKEDKKKEEIKKRSHGKKK